MNWIDQHKTFVVGIILILLSTYLLIGKHIDETIWWAAMSTTFVPMLLKEGAVQVSQARAEAQVASDARAAQQ